MPSLLLSILVVDDAKFSSIMIGRALNQAGYTGARLNGNHFTLLSHIGDSQELSLASFKRIYAVRFNAPLPV